LLLQWRYTKNIDRKTVRKAVKYATEKWKPIFEATITGFQPAPPWGRKKLDGSFRSGILQCTIRKIGAGFTEGGRVDNFFRHPLFKRKAGFDVRF
jgi:hypothetical protein